MVFSCVEGVGVGVLVAGVSVDAGADVCCSGSVVISIAIRDQEREVNWDCIDVDVDQIIARGDLVEVILIRSVGKGGIGDGFG